MTADASKLSASRGSVVLALGIVGGLVLALVLALGWGIWYRESVWRWTDHAPHHGWAHCINETGMPVAWGWRYQGLSDWNFIKGDWFFNEPEPTKWRPEAQVESILPGFPGWAGRVVEVRVEFPTASGLPAASSSFVFQPGVHVRVRASSNGQVFLALGSATRIGYATFGLEQQIGGS